jgi:hypothetical protein
MNATNVEQLESNPEMKIATLPKSGHHLFHNIVDFLEVDRGVKIELDHIVMPGRPDFIDHETPAIVTTRDPRGYLLSLLNWFNKQTSAFLTGAMPPEEAPLYFEPHKAERWSKMTDDERLFALIYDTKSSLLVVPTRGSYDHLIAAKLKPNCYVAKFEVYAPAKSVENLGADTIEEYVRMFGHLGIEMTGDYARRMVEKAWGHSVTWSDTPVDQWKTRLSHTIQSVVIDLYQDVFDAFGYPAEIQTAQSTLLVSAA